MVIAEDVSPVRCLVEDAGRRGRGNRRVEKETATDERDPGTRRRRARRLTPIRTNIRHDTMYTVKATQIASYRANQGARFVARARARRAESRR